MNEDKNRGGRPRQHGLRQLRTAVRTLTTRRLDGRSAVAVAVRTFKADIRHDLGGNLTRAQEAILEAAGQNWLILCSLDAWIAAQPSLVTRKRRVLDVVMQRQSIAEGLAKHLDRLGLERRAQPVGDLVGALGRAQRGVHEHIQ